MAHPRKVGIIICHRYGSCAGGKCFRALKNREGAFEFYKDQDVELVGFAHCGGCPGKSIEDIAEEMKTNGAEIIHLATGMLIGFPACPHLETIENFIQSNYGIQVIRGTHPIPQKYLEKHSNLGTTFNSDWPDLVEKILSDQESRNQYN